MLTISKKTYAFISSIFLLFFVTNIHAITLNYSYTGTVSSADGNLADDYSVDDIVHGFMSIDFGLNDGVSDSFGDSGGLVKSLGFYGACGFGTCFNDINLILDSSRFLNSSTDADAQINAFDLLSLDGYFGDLTSSVFPADEPGKLYLDNDEFSFLTLGEATPFGPTILGTVTFSGDWTRVTELPEISAVPIPAAVWLFGTAIAGFAGFSRYKKKALN